MTIKDHLRSLADRKAPPDTEEATADEPVSPSAVPAHVKESLVVVAGDSRQGRGFIVDGDGTIVTNFHLIDSAFRVKITTQSGDIFLGKVVRTDVGLDLALVQIPSTTAHYLTVGETGSVDVGEEVFMFEGADGPTADTRKVIINALRVIEGKAVVQVDRPVGPANSGSPLVTSQGAVAGIVSDRVGHGSDEAGFALSVKELKAFISGA